MKLFSKFRLPVLAAIVAAFSIQALIAIGEDPVDPRLHVRQTNTAINKSTYGKDSPQFRMVPVPTDATAPGPRVLSQEQIQIHTALDKDSPAHNLATGSARSDTGSSQDRVRVGSQFIASHENEDHEYKNPAHEQPKVGVDRTEKGGVGGSHHNAQPGDHSKNVAVALQTGDPLSSALNQTDENIRRNEMMALNEGLVIAVRTVANNRRGLVFNSDGYLGGNDYIYYYDTYRNMGITMDWVSGSSYSYTYSINGYLDYDTNVTDFIVGGNLSIVRTTNGPTGNRAYIYKASGYAGYMDGITSYKVGHNIAILRTSSQIYVYTYNGGLVDTLNISNASTSAGDNVAVVLSGATNTAYIYNSATGYIDYENNIADYHVGGNMLIVRSYSNNAYIYSDLGYRGYEVNIHDFQAGGDMAIVRSYPGVNGTTYTYKYNGYLYSDSNNSDYQAGETIATVAKIGGTTYTYKFTGYYSDTYVQDFAVGGYMATVRRDTSHSHTCYVYSDQLYVSYDNSCYDYAVGGSMSTNMVSGSYTVYTYSDTAYIGSTGNGYYMVPGGSMTVVEDYPGNTKVYNRSGVIDTFTSGENVLNYKAGENMSAVLAGSLRTAYIYKYGGYLDYETGVNNYVVAGLYSNSGGSVGIHDPTTSNPDSFKLSQNYPNPFNPSTTIKYAVSGKASKVTLAIYDITGKLVQTLVNNEMKSPGEYSVQWNASNFASGTYFCKVIADGQNVAPIRMMLIK